MHTSTVTVSVLTDDPAAIGGLDNADLSLRWFSGTGKGGQHRNKHQNSVEVTHVPTGISRSAQTRSRETSLKNAREELEKAVSQASRLDRHRAVNEVRSGQIGLGMRGDKRRTWRMRDNTVSDDVTGRSTSYERALKGHVDDLWPRS